MHPDPDVVPAPHRRHQGGFTLLETLLALGLVAMVMGAVLQSVLVMTRSSEFGQARLDRAVQMDAASARMSAELRLTDSFGSDPVTGLPYLSITGSAGDQVLAFRRVLTFAESAGEVVAVWSTPIEYRRVGRDLVRRQDGADEVLLRGTGALDFAVDTLGRLHVAVVREAEPGATGAPERRDLLVSPFQGL